MSNNHARVTDRLQLYGMYHIRYVHAGTRPQTKTIRALFLGETKKLVDHTLTELADRYDGKEPSVLDRYLDVVFMTYRPGTGTPESPPSSRYDVFTIFYCNPDGLTYISEGNIVVLPSNYRVKQFANRPEAPHLELLQKLRGIGENSGLIDTNLEKIGKKGSSPLTRTKIREMHRGFTKLVEKAKPDAGLPE